MGDPISTQAIPTIDRGGSGDVIFGGTHQIDLGTRWADGVTLVELGSPSLISTISIRLSRVGSTRLELMVELWLPLVMVFCTSRPVVRLVVTVSYV